MKVYHTGYRSRNTHESQGTTRHSKQVLMKVKELLDIQMTMLLSTILKKIL